MRPFNQAPDKNFTYIIIAKRVFVNLIIPQKSFMPQSGLRAGYGKGKFSKREKPSKPFRPAKNLPTLKKSFTRKRTKILRFTIT